MYCFDTFQGVNYQINVAKEPGERIEGLSWPDGTPVADEDMFVITTNNYRANTMLLVSDELFGKDDAPKLLETDVRSSIGGIRELIADYIQNVKGGSISPVCDNNWSIVGIDWDEELHQRVVELGELLLASCCESARGRIRGYSACSVLRQWVSTAGTSRSASSSAP